MPSPRRRAPGDWCIRVCRNAAGFPLRPQPAAFLAVQRLSDDPESRTEQTPGRRAREGGLAPQPHTRECCRSGVTSQGSFRDRRIAPLGRVHGRPSVRLSDLWTLWTDFSANEKLLRTREPSLYLRCARERGELLARKQRATCRQRHAMSVVSPKRSEIVGLFRHYS